MSDATDSADRPALKPSEIEVTPDLIEAVLTELYAADIEFPRARETAELIVKAVLANRPQ